MDLDLAVNGALVTLAGFGSRVLSVGVQDGRVARLSEEPITEARRVIDASGFHLIPGVVDAHAHYGLGASEDFTTESKAAVRGGITTILSYLLKKDVDYTPHFQELHTAGREESLVDFAFHFGVSSIEQAENFRTVTEDFGVTSHKYFMSFKRPGEGDYIGVGPGHDGILYRIMREAAAYPDLTLVVHSENIEVVWSLADELRAEGRDGLEAWNASRPDFTESHALGTAALFGELTGARVYIPHVSTAAGIAAAQRFGRSKPILETCPHYLTHTFLDEVPASLGKVNPPLRSADDVEALWQAVFDGTVDVIASDHNSRTRDAKESDIWTASAGFPSQGTMLPVIATEGVHRRGLSMERMVELLCATPSKVFGLYPRKGTLLPGSDADFTLLDMQKEASVDVSSWGSRSDYSLYEGRPLRGWPTATFLRGQQVWSDVDGWASPSHGEYLRR